MQLAKRVWDFSTNQDLLHDGDRVVLGVSGGPDSLCLLDVLGTLAAGHGLVLQVAHLNHGLRPEADAEAARVQTEAERRGLAFFSETVDVAAAAAAGKQSIETAARKARYDFFKRVARRTGAGRVAVAHTADDQAETVLMHLLRGAGLRGLSGMRPKRSVGEVGMRISETTTAEQLPPAATHDEIPLTLIRPLLDITRAEVMAYCAERRLTPTIDSSNADPRYFRNRLRHQLLPLLETYNPNVRGVLARMATVAAGDYEIWLAAVQKLWAATVADTPPDPSRVVFDRRRWLALSVAQQRALLRVAVENLLLVPEEIAFAPLEAAVHFSCHAEPGRSCALTGELVLRVEAAQIVISGAAEAPDGRDQPGMVGGKLAPGWQLSTEELEF